MIVNINKPYLFIIGKKIEESQLLANQGKQTVINKMNEEESLRFASETKESEVTKIFLKYLLFFST